MVEPQRGPEPTSDRRPHLDGLRTVAVYLVVAFHAGLGSMPGGFVGVDLFFVLSGYLVTGLLVRDLGGTGGAGGVGLLGFYARRARRLLPAALVALLVTAAAYAAVASPAQAEASADDFRAAALYVSNWHFVAEATDYFASDIDASPVLHFWSLSVEEQYYLLWPLALVGLWRVVRPEASEGRRRLLVGVVGAGAAGSLVWALALRGPSSAHAYLGTDARVYQLFAGALLALVPWWRASGLVRRLAPLAGPAALAALLVVASSLVSLDPVVRGAAAALATVVLLVALECGRRSGLGSLLSLGPLAYLGRISYATYLWHWPVVVLLREAGVVPSPVALAAIVAVLATGGAAVSQRLLESPVRESRTLDARPLGVVVAAVAASLAAGLVLLPMLTTGSGPVAAMLLSAAALAVCLVPLGVGRGGRRSVRSAGRRHRFAVAILAGVAVIGTSVAAGATRAEVGDAAPVDWRAARDDFVEVADCTADALDLCVVVDGTGPTVMLVGDSHARMLVPAFVEVAESLGLRLVVASELACPWLVDVTTVLFANRCLDVKADWYGPVLDAYDPDVVVFAQRRMDDPAAPVLLAIGRERFVRTGEPGFEEAVAAQTAATLDLVGAGDRRVVFVEGLPQPPEADDPIACLSRGGDATTCTFDAPPTGVEDGIQRRLAESGPAVWSVDLDPLLCPDLPVCRAVVDDVVVWRDNSHLTRTFAAGLAPALSLLLVDGGVVAVG